jgi:glycerol kinase
LPDFVAAIDQGTTSTRFSVFDRSGKTISCAQKEHEQIYPQAGWVEHDADEIWRGTQEVIADALQKGSIAPAQIGAIGITNQRETVVIWDRATGCPVSRAIVWQDTRVSELVSAFSQHGGQDRFRSKTGLPLSTYFSGLKVRWMLDHIPGLRARAEAGDVLFGTIDSFLVWKLTGGREHVTDVTNASRTQLVNLETLAWDDELLQEIGIPDAMLPRIVSSSEVYGESSYTAVQGLPIAGILGDQQAALVGQACFQPGEAKNTYGTGCFLLLNTGRKIAHSQHGLLTTVAYKFGQQPAIYALEGSVAVTGALVQWLRDNLGLIQQSGEIEKLAQTVPDNGGVYFVPAFSGLFAPHWNHRARGVIAGLTRYAHKGHIARAALEATAYQTREVIEAMERDAGIRLDTLRVDGGMVENELLMQFQADILDRPLVRPAQRETTSLGAAYAAGLAVGFFRDLGELTANWEVARRWNPRMSDERREDLYRQWKKAITRTFDWAE